MKAILTILFTFLILTAVVEGKACGNKPEEVTITGKVLNIIQDNALLTLVINRVAFPPEKIEIDLDDSGSFSYSFASYIPSDVYISCGNYFYLLVNPGDSIHVEFDGKRKNFLEEIKYSGDAIKLNQDASAFQNLFSSEGLFANPDNYMSKIRESNPEEYSHFLDSCRLELSKLYASFIKHYNPDEKAKNWISTFLTKEYYYNYAFYPSIHSQLNDLKEAHSDVPEDYYNRLRKIGHVDASMTICTEALNSLINVYHYLYALKKTIDENNQFMGDTTKTELEKWSLIFDGVVKNTPDPLMRQMVITEMFVDKLNKSDIELFEDKRKVIEEYVKAPYLKEPLFNLYYKAKEELENPQISRDAVLNIPKDFSVKQIIDSIISVNNGRVIYLDCWATWCSPCLREMPDSKKLMKEFNKDSVAFIYVCVDSGEDIWKATLGKLQLGGQNFYLNKQQSAELRHTFNIIGIPFYILMNKDGKIVEKGSHLRPDDVKEKIMNLLSEEREVGNL